MCKFTPSPPNALVATTFTALTLLVGCQQEYLACKRVSQLLSDITM